MLSPDPTPVDRPGLVYDSVRHRMVLFGGSDNEGALGETWEWDGTSWLRRDVPGPVHRFSHDMVFDAERGVCVVFGGADGFGGKLLGDTWEYDGRAWKQVSDSGPSPRIGHAMTWDNRRKRTLLFGGAGPGPEDPTHHDTWEWDGSRWQSVAATGPSGNHFHRMTCDERRGRIVSFGGRGGGSDTWEFDGSTWLRVATAGPSPRDHHAVSYDPDQGRVVVFGGGLQKPDGDFANVWLNDLWAWDGAKWMQLAASGPPSRGGQPGLAYDRARKRLVLFGGGGTSDHHLPGTWEWDEGWRRAR